ncbi:uncharacterized protein LOC120661940 isoform X2 [Panicum virgatum]|uniref:Uncharacterized protein n=1 Tax=Panicum virgatum TaxID=38727 RepID=A0A8T0VY26_PANVG|nr:uncharacterized protein LOC120661940 isoform X2 [Panicum virgatum]KAG2638576.1 hypothetical protein PVAP13_2NG603500 [Panicum virgatum]
MTEVPPAAPGAQATAAASPAGERDEQASTFDEPRRSRRWRARAERGGRRAGAAGRADAGAGDGSDPSGCERSVCACARTCAVQARPWSGSRSSVPWARLVVGLLLLVLLGYAFIKWGLPFLSEKVMFLV